MSGFWRFMDDLVPIGVVWVIFYFVYLIIKILAQRKERQMMVDKMAENPNITLPSLDNEMVKRTNPYGWIKPAGMVIGLGVGLIIAGIVVGQTPMTHYGDVTVSVMVEDRTLTMIAFGIMILCGGLGMIGGYFIERRLRKNDEK